MEVTYLMELPEPISQMVFAELQTILEVRIINAEALAVHTKGKLWWAEVDGRYYIDYEDDYYYMKFAVVDAIEERVKEIVIEKGTKIVTIDAEEIMKRVLSSFLVEEVKNHDN